MDRKAIIERILDHAERPRGKAKLDDPDLVQAGGNPGCGDVIIWMVHLDGEGRIRDVGWEGQGCNLSQAGASMLSSRLEGLSLDEILDLPADLLIEEIGPQMALTRPACSSLALNTIKTAVYRYKQERERAAREA
jgi:nitrogen fixation NifU-like protein